MKYDTMIGEETIKKELNRWYNKKVVPNDIHLTPESLAHWFMAKGHNHQKRASITLHTTSFTMNEVNFLIDRLKNDLDITGSVEKRAGKPVIYIGKKDYFRFIDIVKPYVIWDCFQYKIDTSKVKETREGWGRYKLTMEDAKEIRSLYYTGNITQKGLADLFKVSQGMIAKIINNKAHKEQRVVGFGGESECRIGYIIL